MGPRTLFSDSGSELVQPVSGDPTPSAEDQVFTRRMEQACEIVGLRLLDHLIVCARERWTSLLRKATW